MSTLCPKCGLACEKDEYRVHISNHCQPTVKCPICSQYYANANALLRHTRAIHNEEFRCTLCPNKLCASKYDLKRHLAMTHKVIGEGKASIKTYNCTECDKTFVGKFFLDRHIEGSHKKSFKCNLCARVFASDNSLKRHIIYMHTNEKIDVEEKVKAFQPDCPICGEQFIGSWSLKRHIRAAHNKEFACHICEKDCSSKKALENHIENRHAVEESEEDLFKKKFKCPQCPLRFTASWTLKTHIEGKHEQKFKCDICNESLSAPYPLARHKRNKHGIEPTKSTNESNGPKIKKPKETDNVKEGNAKRNALPTTSHQVKIEESVVQQNLEDKQLEILSIKKEIMK